jgi:cell wall assembly regulator SMI1
VQKKLTEHDIKEVEQKIDLEFPKDFKDFYLKENGGIPEKSYFYRDDPIWGYIQLNVFYSMKFHLETLDMPLLEDRYLDFAKRNVIPTHYLPFANDHGGNQFCLDTRNEDVVIIFLDLGEVNEDSISFLTNGFGTFVNSLELDGEEDGDDV